MAGAAKTPDDKHIETGTAFRLVSVSMLVFSCLVNVLLLAPAFHLLQVYDRVLISQSRETLFYITLIAAIALVFYAIAEIIRTRIAMRLGNRFMATHADKIFRFLVYDRHNRLNPNETMKDLNTVRAFIAGRQYIGLYDLPFFPLFLIFLFMLHVTLGVLAVIGITVMSVIALCNYRLTETHREKSDRAKSDASNFSLAILRRTDDIRSMGLLPAVMQRWGGKTVFSLNTADDVSRWSATFYGISRGFRQCLQIGVMAWGAFLVLQGNMSGGMIFAASLLLGKTLMPIEQVIGGWDGIAAFREAWRSVSAASMAAQTPSLTELPAPRGHLAAENIIYHPGQEQGQKPILDNVSFDLKPGEVLAVVGPSGAGKSTIARLVVGAMVPTSGTVRLDGFDLQHWPEYQRGAAIGYVPQDIILFPGTISENIARLDPAARDEDILHAAELTGVHQMIASLPDGYGTQVGPGAVPLSGGQRQRIALARAFYSEPKILVLDEPNAHLDQYGEQLLMQSVKRAKEAGVGVLIISQRRSILKIADRVMVILGGKVHSISKGEPQSATNQKIAPEVLQEQPHKTLKQREAPQKVVPLKQPDAEPSRQEQPVTTDERTVFRALRKRVEAGSLSDWAEAGSHPVRESETGKREGQDQK